MGEPSRKYIDLIFKVTGKYGNWDPPRIVEVGDWGVIDRASGNFIREGNIFEDTECKVLLADIPDSQLVKTGNPEDVIRITANAQMEVEGDLLTGINATGEVAVRVHAAWKFTPRNRAAILTITDAYTYYLEVGTVFTRLRPVRKLQGKAIVTEALRCPAYAMLLTDKGVGGKASLTLHTGLAEAGAGLAGGGTLGWQHSSESGFWRSALGYRKVLEGKDSVYTPLYKLKKVSRSWRTRYRGPPASGTTLEPVSEDYLPPWQELDEDGEEIPVDDSSVPTDF